MGPFDLGMVRRRNGKIHEGGWDREAFAGLASFRYLVGFYPVTECDGRISKTVRTKRERFVCGEVGGCALQVAFQGECARNTHQRDVCECVFWGPCGLCCGSGCLRCLFFLPLVKMDARSVCSTRCVAVRGLPVRELEETNKGGSQYDTIPGRRTFGEGTLRSGSLASVCCSYINICTIGHGEPARVATTYSEISNLRDIPVPFSNTKRSHFGIETHRDPSIEKSPNKPAVRKASHTIFNRIPTQLLMPTFFTNRLSIEP